MELTGYASIDKPWLQYYPRDVYESELPKMTIYDYILSGNNFYPNRTALNYFGTKITYGQLIYNIDIVARAFISFGIKKGDIVTISTPTTPEFIYMFYALSKIGAISNMIDPRKSTEEIEEYTKHVNSKFIAVVDIIADKVKNIRKHTDVETIMIISPSESFNKTLKSAYKVKTKLTTKKKYSKKDRFISWKDFYNSGVYRTNNVIVEDFPKYEENTPVTIVYTGGTTGISKGVMLSNDNLNSASYQCEISGYDFQRQHRWLNIMPPFIAYGVGNGLHLPLRCGMEVVLIPQFDPNKFDKLLYKFEPNHMTGVPTHYDSVMKSKLFNKNGLRFIYSAIVGGDKLDESSEVKINTFLDLHDCNYKISKGYGLSEVCAAVCCTSRDRYNVVGSVGIPFSHTVMATFDVSTGEELKYKELGEICITGPNTMLGYYDNIEETNNIMKKHADGLTWIHSGDIGYVDEDGKIFIVGRTKEMIVRHDGFKVYPILIEQVILSHPSISACKVVGIRDYTFSQGELPKVHIVLNKKDSDNTEEIEKELKKLCLEKLAEYLQPVEFKFRDSMPLTPIGKIDFMKLKKEDEENN